MTLTGRCLCKTVNFRSTGAPSWSGYCHCESCRRNCSAPVTAFVEVPKSGFRWTTGAPQIYDSGPGIRRMFCSACGSPMAFEADHYPGVIHLYLASLDDPDLVPPQEHVHVEEGVSWFHIADDLKRTSGFSTSHDSMKDTNASTDQTE